MKRVNNFDRQNHLGYVSQRNSGIELLKIFAIVLIVLSHVMQTLWYNTDLKPEQNTADMQRLMLVIFSYSGVIGNTIFFICSAWFLVDSKRNNKRKVLQMIADIWMVSVIILSALVLCKQKIEVGGGTLISLLFPTTFGNNWYMTCYILFYLLYPLLNSAISAIDKKTLLRTCIILIILYFGIEFLFENLFFSSVLIYWIAIYFIIAYIKRYLMVLADSLKFNLMLFAAGFIGTFGLIIMTNFLGMRFSFLKDDLMRWDTSNNPFILIMVISLLNLVRRKSFKSRVINYISGLSFLIYIIHENYLLRIYYRPLLWKYALDKFGNDHLVGLTLLMVAVVFAFGFICAFTYKLTIQKVIKRICNRIYPAVSKMWNRMENRILNFNQADRKSQT